MHAYTLHVCLYVSVHACTPHASVCLQRPEDSLSLFPQVPSTLVFERGPLTSLGFTHSLAWLVREPQASSYLCLSEITSVCYHALALKMGAGDKTWVLMLAQKAPY